MILVAFFSLEVYEVVSFPFPPLSDSAFLVVALLLPSVWILAFLALFCFHTLRTLLDSQSACYGYCRVAGTLASEGSAHLSRNLSVLLANSCLLYAYLVNNLSIYLSPWVSIKTWSSPCFLSVRRW